MLSAQPQETLSNKYWQEGWSEVTFAAWQRGCSCAAAEKQEGHSSLDEVPWGRAREGLKVTIARTKPPAPRVHGVTLSWGCSLQGATCRVHPVPRAEPAGQDLAQM